MQPPVPSSGRLTITEVEAEYRLAADHPASASARSRLDRLIERRLASALGELLEPAFRADDPSVWLIRGLDHELTCDLAALDDARLVDALAASVGHGLLATLAAGPRGDRVLRYRDRAAFVAAFVTDLAAGRAWGRWQYGGFETLRSLPRPRAIAEALLREPEEIPAVLARLVEDGGLDAVLDGLSEPAAHRVVGATAAAGGDGGEGLDPGLLAVMVEGLGELVASGRELAASPWRACLRLLAGLTADDPSRLARPGLRPALEAAVVLAVLAPSGDGLRGLEGSALAAAVEALERRGLPELIPLLPRLRALERRRPGTLASLAERLRVRRGPGPRPGTLGGHELPFESGFAGLFFLLPSYVALEVEALLDDLDDGRDLLPDRERPLLRRLVFARIFGPGSWRRALDDPAVRLAAGLSPTPASPDSVHDLPSAQGELAASLDRRLPAWWRERQARSPLLAGCDPSDLEPSSTDPPSGPFPEGLDPGLGRQAARLARALLRHFAARLPGFARASDDHLVRNFLTGIGRVELSPRGIEVDLPRMPLAVVARMAGADGRVYELPWLSRPIFLRSTGG